MSASIRPEDALAYHRATGCSLAGASTALKAMEPLLRERVLRAVAHASGPIRLHDPIEDDADTMTLIAAARAEAEALARAAGLSGRGSCHFIWREQARILAERHGLAWYSPQRMNPSMFYD